MDQEDDEFEGYSISKELIIEAISKVRAADKLKQKPGNKAANLKKSVAEIKHIFSDSFVRKVMTGIKMKNFKSSE